MTYSAENPQDSPAPRRSATSRALPLAPLALLSCTGIYSFWCFCAASATQRNAASAPQRLLSYCYSYRVWTVTAAVQCERCVFCLFIHNNIIRAQGYRVPAVPGYRRERPARPAGKRYRLPGTWCIAPWVQARIIIRYVPGTEYTGTGTSAGPGTRTPLPVPAP